MVARIHIVQPGDSLYSIGKEYGVDYQQIARDNAIEQENMADLVFGQTIVIKTDDVGSKNRDILVNGYAYPNISENTLDKTLSNLTFLSLFSYEALEDGGLNPIVVPKAEDNAIAKAIAAGVKPALVVTNIGKSGNFEADLAHKILNNPAVASNLIDNLLKIMKNKKYAGLDVDFEYVLPADRQAYNDFLTKCAQVMHGNGYFISCAIPAKQAENTSDTLTGAYDYAAIGSIVDYVTLMTYEWGYATDGAMAVAPIGNVEGTIKFAATQMPPAKILMGIPNYGYDWPVPASRDNPGKAISNVAAVDLARQHNQAISFDENSKAPFFSYYIDSKRREVWFEDARSVQAKLALVAKYDLSGVSYWTVNKFWPQNWLVLKSMYNVIKK